MSRLPGITGGTTALALALTAAEFLHGEAKPVARHDLALDHPAGRYHVQVTEVLTGASAEAMLRLE